MTIPQPLPALNRDAPFREGSRGLDFTVGEFWQWAYSDLRANTTRGVLAEFLVARALGASLTIRGAWDNFDILAPDGTKVEVKATGLAQSWHQEKPSKPSFKGLKAREWLGGTQYTPDARYRADAYVFCLHLATLGMDYDPLDLLMWEFRVIGRSRLVKLNQKSMGLSTLHRLAPSAVRYSDLHSTVTAIGLHERAG